MSTKYVAIIEKKMNYLPIPIRHYFHYAIIIERKKQYLFPQEVQFFYKICSCYSNFTVKNFSGVLHDLLSDIFARYALFYITDTFIRNWQKIQANAKSCPEAELLLLENYSYCSSTISAKNNILHSKK